MPDGLYLSRKKLKKKASEPPLKYFRELKGVNSPNTKNSPTILTNNLVFDQSF
jgi:hypothetical protein